MKKMAIALVLAGSVLAVQSAMAESQTVSVGYAHSKIENAFDLNGVNLSYRYEWNSPLGLMGSFTWMKGNDELHGGYDGITTWRDHEDAKYYSLMVGPTYRITDWVSVYGSLGFANVDAKSDVNYGEGYHEHFSSNATGFAWGAGVMFNPMENLSLNVGYEGTNVDLGDSRAINGFNVGLGYRF